MLPHGKLVPRDRGHLRTQQSRSLGSAAVPHLTRVAIDGPPAAGRTTLADELAVVHTDHEEPGPPFE